MATRYLGEAGGKAYSDASPTSADSTNVTVKTESWLTVDYGKMAG